MQLNIEIPTGIVPAEGILPALRKVVNDAVAAGVARLPGGEAEVSCRAGCGACCRQLVPVSDIEARALAALVDRQPEPRRTALLTRFEDAARRLDQAGLGEEALAPTRQPMEVQKTLAARYFSQALPCPFLDAESCSIHPERPLVCREYLVTSPAALCATAGHPDIDPVAVPHLSTLAPRITAPDTGRRDTMALPMLFRWLDKNPVAPAPRPAGEWMGRFLAAAREASS